MTHPVSFPALLSDEDVVKIRSVFVEPQKVYRADSQDAFATVTLHFVLELGEALDNEHFEYKLQKGDWMDDEDKRRSHYIVASVTGPSDSDRQHTVSNLFSMILHKEGVLRDIHPAMIHPHGIEERIKRIPKL